MNKIFKVIYSKVRNCYVVTSEFAKANTKSSTGSEKSKTGKKALLTLGAACAIFCGGFVNVGATVHVEEVPSGTKTVYETTEVDSKLNDKLDKAQAESTYGKATDVATNAAAIQTNKSSIDKLTAEKMDTSTADAKYATKTEVNAKADQSALDNLNTTVVADGNRITALETGKADATTVATNTANIAKNTSDIAKKIDKETADVTYAKSSEVYTKTEVNDALTAASTNVDTKLADYAKTADVNAELAKKADKDSVYSKTEANNTFTTKDELNTAKIELEGKITTAKNELDGKIANNTTNITSNKAAIDDLKTKVGDATGGLTKTVNDLTGKVNTVESDITDLKDKDVALEGKINANSNDITGLKDKDVELEGKINTAKTELTNADTALDAKITANKDKIQQNTDNIASNKTAIDNLKNNVGTVTGGDYLDGSDTIAGNLGRLNKGLTDEVAARTAEDTALGGRIDTEKSEREAADTAINAKIGTIDDVQTNYVKNANSISQNLTKLDKELKDTNDRTAGIKRDDVHNETVIEGKVTIDQDGNVSKVKDLGAEKVTTGSLETTGKSELKGDVTLGTDVNNTVTVNGKTTFKENVKVEKDLTVDGKLNVGKISMKNTDADSHGNNHDSSTTITADGISNTAKITDRDGNVTESKFTHDEKGSTTYAHEGDSTDWKETTSNVTADGVENIAKDSKGNNNTFTQTSTETKNILKDKDAKNTNEFTQTIIETKNTLKDEAGNTSSTRQDAKGNYGYAKDEDGNKSYTKQEGDRIADSVIGADGKKTSSEMTSTDITNTAKDGTIKNDAKDIGNKATNEITNEAGQKITDKVGSNTRITDISSIKDSVGSDTSREMTSGKITDTAGDSSVTTENGKGTTFTKTGSTAFSDGGVTDTNISGNKLTTGRVESNELKVSDKDGNNTADLDVKAREGVTASASNGTTTGSLGVKADEVGSSVKDATGGTNGSSFRQRIDAIMGNVKSADGESEVIQNGNQITSEVGKGESTSSKVTQTKDMLQTALTDGTNYNVSQDATNASAKLLTDGTKTNKTQDNLDSSERKLTNGTYETSSLQTALDITNTAKDGTIKNDAKDIENIASGNIKNSSATMDTTVTGEAKESYGKLTTTIENDESHTVKGNQSTTVEGDVTEDYKKNLTTTVGGDELHEVTGTKTETVTGKVTENFNGGQETNVTGDQITIVSGTQTTTATDIKRNASSSMVDNISNDYGTNTETKVAGKTTTDMTITGTGEKGQYIRGANESRDYLIKGTLKNSETKTVEATSTEITDGSGNTSSTIQDKANLAGSVTNGTETGVSGIHGNADGSVSIDSSVADKTGNVSTINQKKGSITSAVSDGTNSTVISQDKNNVTIASNNGTIAVAGKDIINNATDTITNTAGTKITDTAGDSSVTTENGKGTTFTKTGSTAFSDATDAPTNTNISGNQVTTGRLDANELGISDKDGNNTADLNVKAGNNSGVSASAGNGTTTGSLDVKADEVGSSVKDAAGNGSAFRQRIDEIIGKVGDGTTETEINQGVKDITNTAKGGTIKNDAKDIVNEASDSITEKVGDTNVTTKKKDSTKSVIENTNTVTTIEQTDEQVQTSVSSKDGKKSNISTNYDNAAANQVTEDGQTSTVINNKNGLLIQNSDNQTGFTTEDGTATGTAQGWTNIKGNEISTGKLEANYAKMDYADVMKDLGVRGNANIAGKTTTGELEVTGKSTLKGDVTMEGNATVKNDLTVDGTTTTKDLNVIQNATIGGTLDVTGKASFKDSVDITNNLTVGGNATITGDVTANSYKVGNHTYIDSNGINANGQVIRNVGAGEISETSTDAVNGSQLFATNRRIEQFDSRINEVGANAAAIANLHPMEFDADSKLNVAVGVGNYRNKTATAMGVFYRPNEDVMFNVSSTIGSNDNMVGGGISFRLGSGGNKQKNKALADAAEQNKQLKSQVDTLQAQMDALLSVINPNMSKDFPDVPDNHWAYEAVSRLAGNDIIQGYEDGKYHGERTMTRYEMAAIIYKALQKGAKAEAKLVEEFKPELKALAAHEKA